MTDQIMYRTQDGQVFGILADDDGRDPMVQAREHVAERDRDLTPGYAQRVIVEAWRRPALDISDWFA
jgi:hypothetical protein